MTRRREEKEEIAKEEGGTQESRRRSQEGEGDELGKVKEEDLGKAEEVSSGKRMRRTWEVGGGGLERRKEAGRRTREAQGGWEGNVKSEK
ncbi:hypothetical protein Sjap_019624 [Stephania japonica]|uniref:Uncharacterized protein n=1 Tax=Stephania japonica TaxID=461633 RepID=A0AAP0EZ49_9MAGN